MSIEPGQTLFRYRLIEKIGEGGMGVVWKAVDTSLDRQVAIKVLPEMASGDAERLARFEREAKLLASLNHPNIATLHGLEEADGVRFLTMELVEGQDLAKQLADGTIPVDEALHIAVQITHALEAAHGAGVIHRDLKPANIRVTPEGNIKVLDFGLAKALGPETASGATSASMSPTVTSAGTVAGVILGTAAYMSPEQARGKPVDRRTDVWSFGCVLFELLTGRMAFGAETVTDILAGIIHEEPDWDALPKDTPAAVRRLLRRCLRKDPQDRLRDLGDARIELLEARSEDESRAAAGEEPVSAAKRAVTRRAAWLFALAGVLVGTALTLVAVRGPLVGRSGTDAARGRRLPIALSADHPLWLGRTSRSIAVSPDGAALVYNAKVGDGSQLVRLSLDDFEPQPLDGTQGARFHFFSPDGEWIGFYANDTLQRIPALGGRPLTLAEADVFFGASWGDDGWVYFSCWDEGIRRVREEGGAPEQVVEAPDETQNGGFPVLPEILPGAKAIVYNITGSSFPEDWDLHILPLDSRESRPIAEGAVWGRYASSGHILYSRRGDLLARPFDLDRIESTGPPVSVLEPNMGGGVTPEWDLSRDGTLVYVPMALYADVRTLVWVDLEGGEVPIAAPPRRYNNPRVSPDGTRIAVDAIVNPGDKRDIWVFDLRRDTLSQVTIDPADDSHPLWLPDGRNLVFNSTRDGPRNVYRKSADGSGRVVRITEHDEPQWPLAVTVDGEWIVIDESNDGRMVDLILVRPEEDGEARALIATKQLEGNPSISPDGQWIAYEQGEGKRNVFVERFPDLGDRWQISTDEGYHALWAPDGKTLFYREGTAVYAVPIEYEPHFRPGKPVLLFEKEYLRPGSRRNYDISVDGRRFLMIKPSEQEGVARQINLVFSWLADLERRVSPAP